jgi:sarcosine oxidase, subunit gamma
MPDVEITSVRHGAILSLKAWPSEQGASPRAITLEGAQVPATVGATSGGATRILCIAPGEWLAISDHESSLALRERQGIEMIDLSDAFVAVRVEGQGAGDLLASGCGLDFDPARFPRGTCARTRFAQIPVVMTCLDHTCYELLVARSYGSWLTSWLVDARRGLQGSSLSSSNSFAVADAPRQEAHIP